MNNTVGTMHGLKMNGFVLMIMLATWRSSEATRDFTHPDHGSFMNTMKDPVPSHLKTPKHNHPDISHPHSMDDFPHPGGDISHEQIVHQLKIQGVSHGNVEMMASDIVRQHYSSGISIQNADHTKKQNLKAKHYYDETHPFSGINMEMVSSTIPKMHFKNIDRDGDGNVYIEEVQTYLQREVDTMTVDRVKWLGVHAGQSASDFEGAKGVKEMKKRKREFERTLENLVMDFAQVDADKDGYLILAEFSHLIQMHTDQRLRRNQKHLHVDMNEEFIHPSWREDL